jgi:hypothetical protein
MKKYFPAVEVRVIKKYFPSFPRRGVCEADGVVGVSLIQ